MGPVLHKDRPQALMGILIAMDKPRTASATIYIQEELSDARLRLDELKHYIVRAMDLINGSQNKDQLYSVAGDIIFAVPECLLKIERALGAASMAVNKVDYEEQRQILRPEKVDELERVLEEVRLHMPRRRGVLREESMELPSGRSQTVESEDGPYYYDETRDAWRNRDEDDK